MLGEHSFLNEAIRSTTLFVAQQLPYRNFGVCSCRLPSRVSSVRSR